jgi:hypothetical protein
VTNQLAITVRSSAILAGSGFTFDVKASKKEDLLVITIFAKIVMLRQRRSNLQYS